MNQNGRFIFNGKIKVVEIIDNPDGSAKVIFEADKEFRISFKKFYGLKRWSQKRFEVFLQEAIENMNNLHKKGLLEKMLNESKKETK
jgi:hypothetical protein